MDIVGHTKWPHDTFINTIMSIEVQLSCIGGEKMSLYWFQVFKLCITDTNVNSITQLVDEKVNKSRHA